MAEKIDRKNQPRCANVVDGKPCNHPRSFHGKKQEKGKAALGACKALGCHCPRWQATAKTKV